MKNLPQVTAVSCVSGLFNNKMGIVARGHVKKKQKKRNRFYGADLKPGPVPV